MAKHLKHFRFACFFIFILSCSFSSYSQRITYKDGIKYVENKNPVNKDTLRIGLKFVRKNGGLNAVTDETILYYPVSIVLDNEDNIFILDRGGPDVKIFDSNGRFFRKFGRQGEGPGEFLLPITIDIDGDGNAYVTDIKAHHITVFSPKGEYIRKIHPRVSNWLPEFKVTKTKKLICGTGIGLTYYPDGSNYIEPIMKMYDQEGKLYKEFGNIKYYEDQTICKTANAVLFSIDEEDNIYVAYCFQNRIEQYSSQGQLLMFITRKLNFKPSENPKSIKEIHEDGTVGGVSLPILNIVSCGIGTDYKNRIWVMTFTRQPKYRYIADIEDGETNYAKLEVFNNEGLLTDVISLNEDFAAQMNCLYIKGKRLFLIDNNDASIREYRIIN